MTQKIILGKPSSARGLDQPAPQKNTKPLSVDWEKVINDTQEDHLSVSKPNLEESVMPRSQQAVKFCTGSSYSGEWNQLGMTGKGVYTFPYGCQYEGSFKDGMFHGEGVLKYPMGQQLKCWWEDGRMLTYQFSHVDGLDYNDNWTYCLMPDRRFNISLQKGLKPAGREHTTNQLGRPVFPGLYDTEDGYYNACKRTLVRAVHAADKQDVEKIKETEGLDDNDFWNRITMVSEERHKWITEHCRKGWDEPAGYRPDLYEEWVSGRAKELRKLEEKFPPRGDSIGGSSESSIYKASAAGETIIAIESFDYAGTGRKLSLDRKIAA